MNRPCDTPRCSCGRATRLIVERDKRSEFTPVPKETCGHDKGFIYCFPSYYASDGLCELCYKKEGK